MWITGFIWICSFSEQPQISLSFICFFSLHDLTAFRNSAIDISNYRLGSLKRFSPTRIFRLLVALSTIQWTLNLLINPLRARKLWDYFHQHHLLLIQRKLDKIRGAKTFNSSFSCLASLFFLTNTKTVCSTAVVRGRKKLPAPRWRKH